MNRPWIGITTYHREPDERARFTLPSAYVDAVREAGALPVLLTPGEETPRALLRRLDGIVLSGGGDLDPSRFGSARHPDVYFVCPERDAFELSLVQEALEEELPLLAICRGMQVLNAALGGDLHLHLPDVVGRSIAHRESQERPTGHAVRLESGSRLARIFQARELEEVASWHHQAVARLGRGLRPVAWAADGTVEALALEAAPRVLAVQWHPELQQEPGSQQRKLFAALVQDARSQRRPRPRG